MTTHDDVRRMAAKLPGSVEGEGRFGFAVPVKGKLKGYVWTWSERVHPKKPKVINDRVLAVLVPNLEVKEMLLASDSVRFFTEPHYNGYPAILVRLDDIEPGDLEELIVEAWKCKAPRDLLSQREE